MAPESVPIPNLIGQVFIPVRDMPTAIGWYTRLLGLPARKATHEGTIYDLPALGEVGLALDANQPDFTADGPPRFFWWVDDLESVRAHLEGLQVDTVGDVQDIGSVSFLQFRDPDGNLLMACARN
ncbi:VOC family protein [Microlunatus sp. Gsoil 973]|uniref:VOC family protein n=1 Tax=Microlunatus sp. Gsoil 973 TaxID=2672569 RepID=UPI001E2D29F1|nr:VOC family protein [Microlunatus sp. Gsoil 973]